MSGWLSLRLDGRAHSLRRRHGLTRGEPRDTARESLATPDGSSSGNARGLGSYVGTNGCCRDGAHPKRRRTAPPPAGWAVLPALTVLGSRTWTAPQERWRARDCPGFVAPRVRAVGVRGGRSPEIGRPPAVRRQPPVRDGHEGRRTGLPPALRRAAGRDREHGPPRPRHVTTGAIPVVQLPSGLSFSAGGPRKTGRGTTEWTGVVGR